jgi:tetratricopeptide (TPR) repeat protein
MESGRYRGVIDLCARDRSRARQSLGASRRDVLAIPLASALLWLCSGAMVGQPNPALAQTSSELEQQTDALFQQLLKDPTNVDVNFRYAEAAVKLGNYEGAISALERLLLYNPDFPGVKLQLAELYIRLGSYGAAGAYLDQLEKAPNATPDTRAHVQALRSQMERATSKSKFAINLLTGLRHQSNASAEPAGADIIAGGVPLTLSAISVHKPGWDAFAGGNLGHSYDLGDDVSLDSNALVYVSKQFQLSSIDSAALEVNSGPRFDIGGGGDKRILSLRPYALASNVLLGNRQFLWTVGAGLGADGPITERVGAAGFYEFRSEHFSNLALVPTATDMNAGVHTFGGLLSYQIIDSGNLGFQVSYAIDNARKSFAANKQLVLRASYTQIWQLPPEFGVGPLIVTPLVYRIYSWDDAANPAVDPTLIPVTQEWRFGVTAELGLTNNLAATAYVIREITSSNLAAARSNDTQVIIGLRVAY